MPPLLAEPAAHALLVRGTTSKLDFGSLTGQAVHYIHRAVGNSDEGLVKCSISHPNAESPTP